MALVILKALAEKKGVHYNSIFGKIELNIHYSLDAVGLTASFLSKLAEHQISGNGTAGYFHDHIFVQSEYAKKGIEKHSVLA